MDLFAIALITITDVNAPTIDFRSALIRLVALTPLIGGYLLARESRGVLPLEILAVCLLVMATVIPPSLTATSLPAALTALIARLPAVMLLLGLAFVRDGGFKMVVGLVLMIISGLVLLPQS